MEITEIKDRIIAEFKVKTGDLWDKFKEEDKAILEKAALDAAKLQVQALAGKDISGEMKFVMATFQNMAIAEALLVKNAFGDILKDLATSLGPIVVKSLIGLI